MFSRLVRLLAPAFAAGMALVAAPQPASANEGSLVLKSKIAVSGDVVTYGDLFEGDDPLLATPLMRAPALGASAVVDPAALQTRVRMLGLEWDNAAGVRRVEVSRPARTVDAQAVRDAVFDALVARGFPTDAQLRLANSALSLVAPADYLGQPVVENLSANQASGRFTARVSAYPGGPAYTVSGEMAQMIRMLTPSRQIARGEILSQANLDFTDAPANSTRNGLTDMSQALGQAARRPLHPGALIREADLQMPMLVEKNALVTIVYAIGGLKISAVGKALDAGAKNDVISVQNLKSERVVRVLVRGRNETAVVTPGLLASLQSHEPSSGRIDQ